MLLHFVRPAQMFPRHPARGTQINIRLVCNCSNERQCSQVSLPNLVTVYFSRQIFCCISIDLWPLHVLYKWFLPRRGTVQCSKPLLYFVFKFYQASSFFPPPPPSFEKSWPQSPDLTLCINLSTPLRMIRNQFLLISITPKTNIEVMRIKEMITN